MKMLKGDKEEAGKMNGGIERKKRRRERGRKGGGGTEIITEM